MSQKFEDCLAYRFEAGVAYLDLADPARGNSISTSMSKALNQATSQAMKDGARVVVLDAPEKGFCVGGDLNEFASVDDPGAVVEGIAEDLHIGVRNLLTMDAVVVTVVRGVAAGAGFPLALAGDIVLASDNAFFTMAYTAAGLTPDGGSSLLVHSLGLHKVLHLALMNPRLKAAELQALGVIAHVVPLEELDAARDKVVADLVNGSHKAQVATKKLLRSVAGGDPQAALDREAVTVTAAARADGREGIRAFLDKRKPDFS